MSSDNPYHTDSKPWYKQFWPWMLIGLPSSVVVASLITYFGAIHGAEKQVISEDYYKEGLGINKDLDLDRQAAAYGLQADITINDQQVAMKLTANDPKALTALNGQPIKLELENLSFPDKNLGAVLVKSGEAGQWSGRLNNSLSDEPTKSSWTARLLGANWRISQRIERTVPSHLSLKAS